MKKKIIKFYSSLFQKFLYIHVRVNDEDVWVNYVDKVHMDNFCMHAFCIEKELMKKKIFNVHKFEPAVCHLEW